jgi:hypothetical protein
MYHNNPYLKPDSRPGLAGRFLLRRGKRLQKQSLFVRVLVLRHSRAPPPFTQFDRRAANRRFGCEQLWIP